MAIGLLLALGPLLWVWRRNRAGGLRQVQYALTLLTLFLTFDLVLFGAFTRLTDSGLGCPDWPGCYGMSTPVGARASIAAAQDAMPSGPVTLGKAWIEMIHRYLAAAVGMLILVLAANAWRMHWQAERAGRPAMLRQGMSPWWPSLTLLWVCVQGAFGALTVTMKLFPAIVTLHLLGGLALLGLLGSQAVRQNLLDQARAPIVRTHGLHRLLLLTAVALVAQLALGGWVSTNYAVLACSDFPKCQNSWWPPMNFEQGFELWRGLGLTSAGQPITFSALTAIHYMHRLMALLLLGLLGLLAWRLQRQSELRQPGRWLAWLALLQLVTGLSNVVLEWPLAAAVLHTGGAAALVLVLTWVAAASRAPEPGQRTQPMLTAGLRP
jgi:cytochrome c oxidase assembly protein subunit 15